MLKLLFLLFFLLIPGSVFAYELNDVYTFALCSGGQNYTYNLNYSQVGGWRACGTSVTLDVPGIYQFNLVQAPYSSDSFDVATPVCSSYEYSDWSTCFDSEQSREVITALPLGCQAGEEPVILQSCEMPPSGGGTVDMTETNLILENISQWLQAFVLMVVFWFSGRWLYKIIAI